MKAQCAALAACGSLVGYGRKIGRVCDACPQLGSLQLHLCETLLRAAPLCRRSGVYWQGSQYGRAKKEMQELITKLGAL